MGKCNSLFGLWARRPGRLANVCVCGGLHCTPCNASLSHISITQLCHMSRMLPLILTLAIAEPESDEETEVQGGEVTCFYGCSVTAEQSYYSNPDLWGV